MDRKKEKKQKGELIKSPLVGTFMQRPSEEAAPFVAVGDHVSKGQTVAIVEAMKLMNDIECDFDGVVSEVLVKKWRNCGIRTAIIPNRIAGWRAKKHETFGNQGNSENYSAQTSVFCW